MNVYRYTFPIENYSLDGIFEQHVYFVGEACPTMEQVIKKLAKLSKQEKQLAELEPKWSSHLINSYTSCLACLDSREDNIFLAGGLVGTNTFCQTKYGRKPISLKKIILNNVNSNHTEFTDHLEMR